MLERTKTSGPGKHVGILPVFVSEEAYLETEWLDIGLVLWMDPKSALYFRRDFFLPLPTPDFAGVLRTRAQYTDALGFSRALLGTLRAPASADESFRTALVPAPGCSFWSLHSERAGLDGWCAALGVGDSERGFLGRWAVKSSSDTYIRTACRIVENLQRLAARFARRSIAGGPDFYGEEHILILFGRHLEKQGLTREEAEGVCAKLMLADPLLVPEIGLDLRAAARAPLPPLDDKKEEESGAEADYEEADQDAPTELATSEEDGDDENEVQADDLTLTPRKAKTAASGDEESAERGTEADAQVLPEAALWEAIEAQRPPVPPSTGFVVSKTKGGKHRTLHFLPACWRVPDVHYKQWVAHGELLPDKAEFDAVCSTCMPGGPIRPEEAEDSASSSSSSGEGAALGEPFSKKAKAS